MPDDPAAPHPHGYLSDGLSGVTGRSGIRLLTTCSLLAGIVGAAIPIGVFSVVAGLLGFAARRRLSDAGIRRSPVLLRVAMMLCAVGAAMSTLVLGALVAGRDQSAMRYGVGVGGGFLLALAVMILLMLGWKRVGERATTGPDL
jgi:hypothetical protein